MNFGIKISVSWKEKGIFIDTTFSLNTNMEKMDIFMMPSQSVQE